MNTNAKLLLPLTLLLLSLQTTVVSQDKPAEKKEGPNKIELSGVFESVNAHEIVAATDQIKSLKIEKIVDLGVSVKKGQAIVWFETDSIDKQIVEAESSLELAEVAFKEAELNHGHALSLYKLDVAAAKRTMRIAQQRFDNFERVDRDQELKDVAKELRDAQFSLEYRQEELNQLEQMYKEDELTEESEEIVLKRARRAVESAKHELNKETVLSKREIDQEIPRKAEEKKAELDRQILDYEKSLKSLELAKRKSEIEYETQKRKIEKQRAEFKKLRADRQRMVLKSPIDGIVLPGKLTRGKTTGKPPTAVKGATVTDQQVLLTVVDPTRFKVRLDLPEKHLSEISTGRKAEVIPNAFTDVTINATVNQLSKIPFAPGKFDCVLTISMRGVKVNITPLMECKIVFGREAKSKKASK